MAGSNSTKATTLTNGGTNCENPTKTSFFPVLSINAEALPTVMLNEYTVLEDQEEDKTQMLPTLSVNGERLPTIILNEFTLIATQGLAKTYKMLD